MGSESAFQKWMKEPPDVWWREAARLNDEGAEEFARQGWNAALAAMETQMPERSPSHEETMSRNDLLHIVSERIDKLKEPSP